MRFKSRQAKWREFHRRVNQWHLWFAWYPVPLVGSDRRRTGQVAWLEYVARLEDSPIAIPPWNWIYAEKTMVLVESPKRRYTD